MKSSAYWTQMLQLDVFKMVDAYMKKHHMTRAQFAEKIGVSKGYVTQILNGEFDHKLSTLVNLILACDCVPSLQLTPCEETKTERPAYESRPRTKARMGASMSAEPEAPYSQP